MTNIEIGDLLLNILDIDLNYARISNITNLIFKKLSADLDVDIKENLDIPYLSISSIDISSGMSDEQIASVLSKKIASEIKMKS